MDTEPGGEPRTVDRRKFLEGLLIGSGGAVVGITVGIPLGRVLSSDSEPAPRVTGGAATPTPTAVTVPPSVVPATVTAYPRLRVASLATLSTGDVIDFQYPLSGAQAQLYRLGRPAAGGIGPDRDIVAFSTTCTHMGCPLRGFFKPEHAVLGPCACHFTTFDLTHRGMVVLGQATEHLPQIVLDLDGDDILAVAVMGIAYGFRHNLADAPLVEGL